MSLDTISATILQEEIGWNCDALIKAPGKPIRVADFRFIAGPMDFSLTILRHEI